MIDATVMQLSQGWGIYTRLQSMAVFKQDFGCGKAANLGTGAQDTFQGHLKKQRNKNVLLL
jgi:hypothetical protein